MDGIIPYEFYHPPQVGSFPRDPCGKGMFALLSAARANTAIEGFPALRGIT